MKVRPELLFILLSSFIAGSGFILVKKGLLVFDPVQVATSRLSMTGIVLLPFAWMHRKTVLKKHIVPLLVVGFVGISIPAFIFGFALSHIDSALTAVLNAMPPLWIVIISLVAFGTKVRRLAFVGILIGFGGVCMMSITWPLGWRGDYVYSGLVLLGGICYAISTLTVQRYLPDISSMAVTAFSVVLILPVMLIATLSSGITATYLNSSWALEALGCIAIVAIAGSAFSNMLYYRVIQLRGAHYASVLFYLMPITATSWGLADGEHLGWRYFAGMLMVFSGVYLVIRSKTTRS